MYLIPLFIKLKEQNLVLQYCSTILGGIILIGGTAGFKPSTTKIKLKSKNSIVAIYKLNVL